MRSVRHAPPELSSFVGRAEELAALDRFPVPARLLTLVGPGGCGKTRLALRLAAGFRLDDPDEAWWVALEDLSHPDDVADRVAAALGVTDLRELRERHLLLVLDNCEHVLDGVAGLVTALLGTCPGVTVLATSRAPLRVPGERTWPVPPLSLPDALALFLDRADRRRGDEQRAAVRRICDRLDRLPLALELAAAWTATLTPAQIAGSLADPYALLDGDERTVPFRQRTLSESMRWSHDLLNEGERLLLRRLAVFEPGFDATAVRVAGAVGDPPLGDVAALRALRGLVAASLVVADTTGPAARYRMLGTVRDYALARLAEAGETAPARDAHLRLQLTTVEELAPLLDADREAWRTRIGPDYTNLRAGIEWGLAWEDPTAGRRLAAGLAWLWHDEQHGREGLRLMRRAVERGGDERTALQARCLVGLALVSLTSLPGGPAYPSVRAAMELAEETGAAAAGRLARLIAAIGLLAADLDQARSEAVRAEADARAAGDVFVTEASAALLGLLHLVGDEHRAAIGLLVPAAAALQKLGDRGVASSALCWLALATAQVGRLDRAADLAAQAVRTAAPLRDLHRAGLARAALAEIQVWQGRTAHAARTLAPLDAFTTGPDAGFVPGWGRVHAIVALAEDDVASALDWLAWERAWPAPPVPATELVRARALRRAGDTTTAASVLDGLLRCVQPSIRAAALVEQARLAGDDDAALRLHHEALGLRSAHELGPGCVDSLEAIAALVADRNLAGILAGAAERAREATGYHGLRPSAPDVAYPEEAVARGRAMELADAVALARRARGPRRRPASGWDSLTPMEQSVVALAVQGLSNPDIAARLYVGRGTVKTHLAHVYAKLGVANRTDLARLAAERSVRR